MAVYEAGGNQGVPAVVLDLGAWRQLRTDSVRRPEMGNQSIRNDDDAIGLVNHCMIKPALEGVPHVGQDRTTNDRGFCGHASPPAFSFAFCHSRDANKITQASSSDWYWR